jgi:hypothetical protein
VKLIVDIVTVTTTLNSLQIISPSKIEKDWISPMGLAID